MEPFTTYKMLPEADNELFSASPYCRTPDPNDINFEKIPPLTLEVSNPAKLMKLFELLNDNSTKGLEMKINLYLKTESESSHVFLINLHPDSEGAVVQVVNDVVLETAIRVPLTERLIKKLSKYKNSCLPDAKHGLETIIANLVRQVLGSGHNYVMIPVMNQNPNKEYQNAHLKQRIILVCFTHSPKEKSFLLKLVDETFRYCLTILINTSYCEEETRQKEQCKELLAVARKFYGHLSDLNELLKEIMSEARRLTNSERCSLFLIDPNDLDLVAKVFDGVSSNDTAKEVRIAKDQGIAGHVANTGTLLNIKDAYQHPLFYKGMDKATGFKTRNILCFPIRDEHNIVGVAQLCNKRGGAFDYFDEEIANAFSIYCGLSIVHGLVYKEIQDSQARNRLANELMMYHMKVTPEDVSRVFECPRVHYHPNFDEFSFSPRVILPTENACFVLHMMDDLGLINKFRIKREVMSRFIIFIEKGYRNQPYHNWTHAFSVTHFAYLCLKNFQLVKRKYITELESLTFFVSCLCHDLDHWGTTNSFQEGSYSVLANLYSSQGSVMERHHLSQTLCTLNAEGCNIIESLDRDDYVLFLDLMKDMILATDLATHFKIYNDQLLMAQEGYDASNPKHRYNLLRLLMTAADLSDQTKGWPVIKRVAQSVYEEFFFQGDLEKQMGKKPSEMMDRERASIPVLQIQFLNDVCLATFKVLALLFPQAKQLVSQIKRNILAWESSKCVFTTLASQGMTPIEILSSSELEIEVKKITEQLEI